MLTQEEDSRAEPIYKSLYERFFNCLTNDAWSEEDLELKLANKEEYERALENYELLKGAI